MERSDSSSVDSHSVAPAREIHEMLRKYNKKISAIPLANLVSGADRFEEFSQGIDGVLLDFSRTHLDQEGLELLFSLAASRGVTQARDRLFQGESVNITEDRAAMHMVLRSRELGRHLPDVEFNAMERAMNRMLDLAGSLHRGELPGDELCRVKNILHVGIGGSLLGTRLLCDVFEKGKPEVPAVHFFGSVDAHSRERLLPMLDPRETIVILVSKSFTTADTLMHGARIQQWLTDGLGKQAALQRIFAVTGAKEKAAAMDIPPAQILHLPDWVGGRYSLWSPVSLAAAAISGPDAFRELLEGAAMMDRHFAEAEPGKNLPVLMGLLGVWHRNVCGFSSWGVIPYDQRLRLLPAHLQQLIMESTGKSVRADGSPIEHATAPVVFGESGTDAQHSLFQAMHQGSDKVPLNLVGVIRPGHQDREAQAELLANMLAQATALALGRTADETAEQLGSENTDVDQDLLAHRTFEGNRPTELLLLDDLTPANLGKLLALYEHKVFVESVIWDVNAFDQWGVELGKSLAPDIRRSLTERDTGTPGLTGLLEYIRQRS